MHSAAGAVVAEGDWDAVMCEAVAVEFSLWRCGDTSLETLAVTLAHT
jgi:hypothetical protein